MVHRRPQVFMGVSSEGLAIATAVQRGLKRAARVTLWHHGGMDVGDDLLEWLTASATRFDYAVFVLAPQDFAPHRSPPATTARETILVTLGFFIGVLGKDRTFVISHQDTIHRLRVDLTSVAVVPFSSRADAPMQALIDPICAVLMHAMGIR